jgi:predicted dinucleotide-binding enzyme
LADLALESGATPVSVSEAAHSGDVVIVVPEKDPHLLADLFAGVPDSAVVVNTATTIPNSGMAASTESKPARPRAAGLHSKLCRPVVNAFTNIYAQHLMDLGKPAGAPRRIALPIVGERRRILAVAAARRSY